MDAPTSSSVPVQQPSGSAEETEIFANCEQVEEPAAAAGDRPSWSSVRQAVSVIQAFRLETAAENEEEVEEALSFLQAFNWEPSAESEQEEVKEKNEPAFKSEGEFVHEGRDACAIKADVVMISGCLDFQCSADARIDEKIFKIPNQVGFRGKRKMPTGACMLLQIVPVLTH